MDIDRVKMQERRGLLRRKKQKTKESLKEALRNTFSVPEVFDLTQPLLHINCSGSLELENCGGILEYDAKRIVFRLKDRRVAVTGEAMTIVSLNAHITEIRGQIFRVDLLEAEK
jgi:hypothetical protein